MVAGSGTGAVGGTADPVTDDDGHCVGELKKQSPAVGYIVAVSIGSGEVPRFPVNARFKISDVAVSAAAMLESVDVIDPGGDAVDAVVHLGVQAKLKVSGELVRGKPKFPEVCVAVIATESSIEVDGSKVKLPVSVTVEVRGEGVVNVAEAPESV